MPDPHFYSSTSPNTFAKAKLPFSWPSIPNPIPRRYRRRLRSKFRSAQSPASSIASVETSINPADTLRALRSHRWSYHDGHYLILILLLIFALSISQAPGPMMKTGAASLLMLALLVPVTRQFFLPFLPVLTWLVFFFNARFIPVEYRPHIWVKVLPALENIFYGANLSNILSAHQHVVLDVLAWLPYGLLHFGGPVVWASVMFIFGPPGIVPVFARTFGYMNISGVLIQLIFPCSPPWYENMYGLAPANYAMQGSPAGLARIDQLLGFDMYTSNFTASPLVFGAFPSLHSGNAVLEALFMSYCFPKLRPLVVGYAMWMWWATMYLSHHYAVDLVGGGFLAAIAFYIAKTKFLPRIQMDKAFRWEYDYVEIGEAPSGGYEYGLTTLDADFRHDSSDEWTIGSSSSISSGSRSPVEESNSSWEGDTLASQASDSELSEVIIR
ncbi:Peroxidase [Chlorociboria aeruginascens]|nr:Peroxidase [Chlorociboria aeruginascens]